MEPIAFMPYDALNLVNLPYRVLRRCHPQTTSISISISSSIIIIQELHTYFDHHQEATLSE